MPEAAMNLSNGASAGITQRSADVARLALKVLLVGVICHLSIQVGHAYKFPPHNISALWPTSAILAAILVASPIRHRPCRWAGPFCRQHFRQQCALAGRLLAENNPDEGATFYFTVPVGERRAISEACRGKLKADI